MKILPIRYTMNKSIKKAKKGDSRAQKAIYTQYSPKMLSVCRLYISGLHFAEDVMMKGFLKCFLHINNYQFKGSFEGWLRRIMVNECISYLRVQKNKFEYQELHIVENQSKIDSFYIEQIAVEEIQQFIDELPIGCRTVFNLYAIEEYGHEEIAETLNISESTSRSQLFYARKLLKKKIKNYQNESIRFKNKG